ncbi:hydantoinase B/oxoprolinase family protein [Cohaesibacter marisflavi]|uniref:hydantoinase B/oxoprolinase family protein n=1 Tax=Cohaesibacter marisflavi TaxID=655353 RepID=UPI0029C8BAC8|nr:hydantoinase B/oxoprolinase family protein [Cohaesibacter marisflavi]
MASSDPFTRAVIQAGLTAAAEEMFAVLRKTAMSPIIYEVLDVGTGITDTNGDIVSSGAGIPGFVGVLDKAVKQIIEIYGEDINSGDVFITNDPYWGGVTHLNDVVVAEPVFHGDTRVAWTASIAHWNDVGGKTPGSMAADATEILQEGLRLPAVKLFDKGQKIDSVFKIISVNSRLPDFVMGDLWAQVSAGRRGAKPIKEMAERYGPEELQAAINEAFDIGEARALDGLSKLPEGSFHVSALQDEGDEWHADIHITPKSLTVDLTNAPDQREGPFNTSHDGARIACQLIFKVLTDPTLFANAGSFRPLKVITRKGSIFDPHEPAAHGYYSETRIRLSDMLWQGMAQKMPKRLPSGSFGSICGTVIAGVHPETGRSYTMVEPQMGGWGATSERNGLDAMYSPNHGDTFNCPVEICEARYGIDVGWKALSESPLGNGLYKGGRGMTTSYQPRAKAVMSAGYSHTNVPVWSVAGGEKGGFNTIRVKRPSGEIETYAFASNIKLDLGDEVLIDTANGGGWGSVD